ncbi:C-type mannose receptor 2-like isoform X1 [Gasterosteus aculeatus]
MSQMSGVTPRNLGGQMFVSSHRETSSSSGNRIPKMKTCGPFLLFLCGPVAALGSVVVERYEHVKKCSSWHEAQSHCRSKFTDLGTIYEESDEETNLDSYSAWIGLHKTLSGWFWFDGHEMSLNDPDWAQDEPNPLETCAVVSYGIKKVYGKRCEEHNFFFCEERGSDRFTFVPESKNMSDAEAHCASQNKALASFHIDRIFQSEVKKQDHPVWTGLHREGGAWKWSYDSSEYRNWASQESSATGDCVAISSRNKKMSAQNCEARFPFVCLSTNLVLVREEKTWEEALRHCRALGSSACGSWDYDLVSVQPGDEREHVHVSAAVQEADTEEVWVGLRFLAGSWLWVNGATLLYPDLPSCPHPLQRCGALPKRSAGGGFLLADCAERRNFLCYRKQ